MPSYPSSEKSQPYVKVSTCESRVEVVLHTLEGDYFFGDLVVFPVALDDLED